MKNTKWAWCPTCMTQQDHHKNEEGKMVCDNCGEVNVPFTTRNAIRAVAEKYLEKEKIDEAHKSPNS